MSQTAFKLRSFIKDYLLSISSLQTAFLMLEASLSVRPALILLTCQHPECQKVVNKNSSINNSLQIMPIKTKANSDNFGTDVSSPPTVSLESYHMLSSCYLEPSDYKSPFGQALSSSYATCPVGFTSHGLDLPPSAQWTFLEPTWCHLEDCEGNKVLLGEGSFGEVIKATCYGNETVVKRLKAGQRVCRVLWEADMTAYLSSFGVCPVLLGVIRACSATYSLPALVMEYIPRANDMHQLMEEKGWTFFRLEILDALAQAAILVEFLHKHRILHNDIKHANFLISPNPCYLGREVRGIPPPTRGIPPHWPSRFRVYLIDFANASYKGGTQLRTQGGPGRKYSNIAPEIIVTRANTSFASDVYSFGVLLRYMAKFRLTHYLREVVRRCTQTIPEHRPSMRQVALYLELLTSAQASIHDDNGQLPKDDIDRVIKQVWHVLYKPSL